MGECRGNRARLLSEVHSDRTRGNGYKSEGGKLIGYKKKAFLPRGWSNRTRGAREILEAPSLEIFRTCLGKTLRSLIHLWMSCTGGWARWSPEVPFHLPASVTPKVDGGKDPGAFLLRVQTHRLKGCARTCVCAQSRSEQSLVRDHTPVHVWCESGHSRAAQARVPRLGFLIYLCQVNKILGFCQALIIFHVIAEK